MFDLNRAIEDWRRPFLNTHLYGKRNIDELEDHLRESVQMEIDHAMDAQIAFHRAVDKVGTEPVLRPTFHSEWKSHNPIVRYFLRLKSEVVGLSSQSRSAAYVACRLFTFVQAFTGLLVLEWVYHFLKTAVLWGRYDPFYILRMDFPLLFLCLLFSAGFNLIPFSTQRRGKEYNLRIGFVLICALALTIEWVDLFKGLNHLEVYQMIFWSATLMSGPALWVLQIAGRSSHTSVESQK